MQGVIFAGKAARSAAHSFLPVIFADIKEHRHNVQMTTHISDNEAIDTEPPFQIAHLIVAILRKVSAKAEGSNASIYRDINRLAWIGI
jgi:hypothetical protein